MRIKPIIVFLGDLFLLLLSLLFILWLKQGNTLLIIETYQKSLLLFAGIWILISFLSLKYITPKGKNTFLISAFRIVVTSGVTLGIITSLMFLFRVAFYSRFVVFGTLLSLTIAELFLTAIYSAFKNASAGEPLITIKKYSPATLKRAKNKLSEELLNKEYQLDQEKTKNRRDTILESVGRDALNFIEKHTPIESSHTLFISTINASSIWLISQNNIQAIVNLERVNDFRYINKFFEAVNQQLPKGGLFIDFFESKNQRKKRILKKFPPIINYIYYSFDYIIKRILPKFVLTKKLYFILTRGQNRVLTKAEALGRLYSCGFELIEELETESYTYFVAIKSHKPIYPEQASYGPLIKLKRVGKNGEIITVYKLRTMHPYSEFIQDYVYKKEGLKEGGKFKSDFRVSSVGRFFRMFWIDELPMLVNLINRDIKIVGVRPITEHYFSLYSKEHQKKRIKYTPGLIPPFYVDNPKTLEEIMTSEERYLDAYEKHPIRTDLKYFFKAINNILFKKARSA